MQKRRPCNAAVALCLISQIWVIGPPCRAAESSGPTGTLRIDGKGVQRLQLVDGSGKRHSVEVVDCIVTLAPSTYTVTQIYLTNGLYSGSSGPAKHLTVEVTADGEATLKVGGPLKQRIEAKRQGCMLVMSCFAEGIEGIQYAGRLEPPGFEVYKGDRKIDEGEFEYG